MTGCLLDFAYFEQNYRIIAVDLNKQKDLDADPKAIQQIIFIGFITSLNSQEKQNQNFQKAQQKGCNYR